MLKSWSAYWDVWQTVKDRQGEEGQMVWSCGESEGNTGKHHYIYRAASFFNSSVIQMAASDFTRDIIKMAANHNGRQFNDFGLVFGKGFDRERRIALMDTRHKGAVATWQGDPQITTAARSHLHWVLQVLCLMKVTLIRLVAVLPGDRWQPLLWPTGIMKTKFKWWKCACELSALPGKLCHRINILRREISHWLQSCVTKIVLRDLIAILKLWHFHVFR